MMAGTTSPTPKTSVVVVPDAATTAAWRSLSSTGWVSKRRRSPGGASASRRHVQPNGICTTPPNALPLRAGCQPPLPV